LLTLRILITYSLQAQLIVRTIVNVSVGMPTNIYTCTSSICFCVLNSEYSV